MKNNLKAVFVFLLLALSPLTWGAWPEDFTDAKKTARIVWAEHRETFYCGCPYDRYGVVNYKKCDYVPKDKYKAKRMSWEHVVPVSWYGNKLSCWKEKQCVGKSGKAFSGRECCRLIDPKFKKMEADLHNLVPAIREVNQVRQNYHYAMLPWLHKEEGCQFYVDAKNKQVEPRDDVKGMAARIQLYITEKYNITLPKKEVAMLKEWNKKYPPTAWEKRWHEQVSAIQGDVNSYIQNY